MKTFIFLTGICYCLPVISPAQPFDIWIANRKLASANIFEFDLMIRCLDSGSVIPLKFVQTGYKFSAGFINGGTLSASYVQGSSELEASFGKTWGFSFNSSQKVLNQSANVGSVCPGALIGTEPRRIARFRVVNSVAWGCEDDSLSFVTSGTGILRLAVVKYNTSDCSDPNPSLITSLANSFTQSPNHSLLMAEARLLPGLYPCDTLANVGITAAGGAEPYSGTGVFSVGDGWHIFTVVDARGCEDTVTATVDSIGFVTSFRDSACEKYILPWGNVIIESGIYSHTYISYQGCDSTVIACISILKPSLSADTLEIWPGQLPYYWNGLICPGSGNYFTVLTNTSGCDSQLTLHLIVLDSCSPRRILSTAQDERICAGESVLLTVDGNLPEGGQWKWFSGGCGSGSSIARGSSIRVSPKTTTSYFVRSQGGNCGTTSCTSITIQVKSKPSVPGPITGISTGLCRASDISYSIDPVVSTDYYQWYFPDGAEILSGQGSTSIRVNYSAQLSSNAFTSSNNICVRGVNACAVSACRNLSVSLKPSAAGTIEGPAQLVSGEQSDFLSSVFGATAFSWTVPSGWNIASGQGTRIVSVRAGSSNGYVRLLPSNSCGTGAAGTKYITVSSPLARNQEGMKIDFFPNPASDRLLLRASGILPDHIEITDLQGRLQLSSPFAEVVDIRGLPSGLYILRFFSKDSVHCRRISIIR